MPTPGSWEFKTPDDRKSVDQFTLGYIILGCIYFVGVKIMQWLRYLRNLNIDMSVSRGCRGHGLQYARGLMSYKRVES